MTGDIWVRKLFFYPVYAVLFLMAAGIGAVIFLSTRPPGFEYVLRPAVTVVGHRIDANAFLPDYEHMLGTTIAFSRPVNFSVPGRQSVRVTLRRGDGKMRGRAVLYIAEPLASLRVEKGESLPIQPSDFIANLMAIRSAPLDIRFISDIPDTGELPTGRSRVLLTINGVPFYSSFHVADTTPPTVYTRSAALPLGREISPEDVILSVFDHSPIITKKILNPPDIFTPGTYAVEILVEDYYGNYTIATANITLLPNTTPPTIYGVRDITTALGEPVRFREGVTAEDAFGNGIPFEVDAGLVNINRLGTYPITYTATDHWGLTATATANVYVLSVNPLAVYEMVDGILGRILTNGMTQAQQAKAIFDWVTGNVTYAAAIRMESAHEAAFHGLIHRRGNCFVFYGLSEVMLTRTGIPNRRIDRIPGTPTAHRWNLINPDDMGWHHFDTTPFRLPVNLFMFTDSQAREFTRRMGVEHNFWNFFVFDPDLYPEIVQ
jgi:transglutaminase-like putative cysteine protease